MPLTLRVKAGTATFSLADGPMKAEWALTTDMGEEQLVDALLGMLRFIKKEQPYVPERHLHAVADHVEEKLATDDQNLVDWRAEQERAFAPPGRLTWKPAVQPKPLEDSLEAAAGNGFELLTPEDLAD